MVLPASATPHPHTDCTNEIAVVHNGIIENFAELREELIAKGHTFTSDTDTECIAHLVEENYHGDLFEAVRVVSNSLSGAYGLAVMHHDYPGEIVVTRKDSPIVLGVGENGSYLGSDIIALIDANPVMWLSLKTISLLLCILIILIILMLMVIR